MATRLINMSQNSSVHARNILKDYHKTRPLADIENAFHIHLDDDPFSYKTIVASDTLSLESYNSNDQELISHKSCPVLQSESILESLNNANETIFKNGDPTKYKKIIRERKCISSFQTSKQPKSTRKGKSVSSPFLVLPMDFIEYRYVQKRKELSEKIKQHRNEDALASNRSENLKGAQSSLNSEQWLTITANNNEINTVDPKTSRQNNHSSLINTFANEQNDDDKNVYNVTGTTGTKIAGRLSNGSNIVIGRNGQILKREKIDEFDNKYMITKLLAENEAKASPLCWNDQLQNNAVKILSPRKLAETVVQKPVYERNYYVKKLLDEEAFKPKPKEDYRLMLTQSAKPKSSSSLGLTRLNSAKISSVEVVGLNNIRTVPPEAHFIITSSIATKNPPATAQIPEKAKLVPEEMTEQDFNKVIDNLTNQFSSHKKLEEQVEKRSVSVSHKILEEKFNNDTHNKRLLFDQSNHSTRASTSTKSKPPANTPLAVNQSPIRNLHSSSSVNYDNHGLHSTKNDGIKKGDKKINSQQKLYRASSLLSAKLPVEKTSRKQVPKATETMYISLAKSIEPATRNSTEIKHFARTFSNYENMHTNSTLMYPENPVPSRAEGIMFS